MCRVWEKSNPERIAYWEVVYWFPEKPHEKFRRPFPIDRERARVWERMLRQRGYEAYMLPVYESSNPQKPIDWVYVGAFMDGEGSFSTWIQRERYLKTMIDITQMNQKTGGYNLLNEIKDFIKNELGIEGTLRAVNNYYHLNYFTHIDCYHLAAQFYHTYITQQKSETQSAC